MGVAARPSLAKLVLGMLSNEQELFDAASARLCSCFGRIDYISPTIPFSHTAYYEPEMGTGLLRRFEAYETLVAPDDLPGIKVFTNNLELELALDNKRRINLDPGYLTLAKFVLATTKDQSYRLYLTQGIYGEVTCNYRKRVWAPNPWTYPDYRSVEYLQILSEIRAIYSAQLKQRQPGV